MKSRAGQRQRGERSEERRSEKRKNQKKEDADARKGRKVAKHCVFPMICGFGGSKSRLAKAAGAEIAFSPTPVLRLLRAKAHADAFECWSSKVSCAARIGSQP